MMTIKQIKAKVPCTSCDGTGRKAESYSSCDYIQAEDGCSSCGGVYHHAGIWSRAYTSSGCGWVWEMIDDPYEVQRIKDEKEANERKAKPVSTPTRAPVRKVVSKPTKNSDFSGWPHIIIGILSLVVVVWFISWMWFSHTEPAESIVNNTVYTDNVQPDKSVTHNSKATAKKVPINTKPTKPKQLVSVPLHTKTPQERYDEHPDRYSMSPTETAEFLKNVKMTEVNN